MRCLPLRELAKCIKMAGINFRELPWENMMSLWYFHRCWFDFGVTGGVMEAALRTVYEVVAGKTLEKVDFVEVRGLEGVKRR